MNNTFSLDIAKNLIDSKDQFPVNFDDAWKWLKFSRKDVAKRSFENCGFVEGIDFTSFHQKVERKIGATSKEVIQMTVDCFKCWAMMSKTETGKLVRQYFLECEKLAKANVLKPKTALELAKEQVKLLEQIEIQHHIIASQERDLIRQSEMIDELFDYSSIIRVAKFNKVSETNFSWLFLKTTSKAMNLEVKKAPCPRYGTKNLYSHDVWRYCYPNFQLPETTTLVI